MRLVSFSFPILVISGKSISVPVENIIPPEGCENIDRCEFLNEISKATTRPAPGNKDGFYDKSLKNCNPQNQGGLLANDLLGFDFSSNFQGFLNKYLGANLDRCIPSTFDGCGNKNPTPQQVIRDRLVPIDRPSYATVKYPVFITSTVVKHVPIMIPAPQTLPSFKNPCCGGVKPCGSCNVPVSTLYGNQNYGGVSPSVYPTVPNSGYPPSQSSYPVTGGQPSYQPSGAYPVAVGQPSYQFPNQSAFPAPGAYTAPNQSNNSNQSTKKNRKHKKRKSERVDILCSCKLVGNGNLEDCSCDTKDKK